MIILAREKNWLYCLKESDKQNRIGNNVPFSFLFESPLSNKNKILLYHLHLGHPLFNVLQIIFLDLVKAIDMGIFHCDVCELGKHRRTSFPISNKRMASPFALIYSDVWGPFTVPNFFRLIGLFCLLMIALVCHGYFC